MLMLLRTDDFDGPVRMHALEKCRLFARLHEEVVALVINEPIDPVLLALGAAAAAAGEDMGGWGVDG